MRFLAFVFVIVCILAVIGLMNIHTLIDDTPRGLPHVEFVELSGADMVELDLIAAYYEQCQEHSHTAVCATWAYHKAQETLP